MARPTRTIVDLDAIRHNYRLAQSLSGSGQCVAVVKANAYGHGAVAVAKALEATAPAFGVACIEEAQELREAGISKPILLLEGTFSPDEVLEAARENYWLMLDNESQAQAVLEASLAQPLDIWIKVDTGMHRLGVDPASARGLFERLKASDNVANLVIATHMSSADELDNDCTLRQLRTLQEITVGLDAPLSIANSPSLLGWPQCRGDWNRPGFMLYGNSPFTEAHPQADQLRHAMTLETAVISVRSITAGESVGYAASWTAQRDSVIATVAVGYGDGYPRHAPSGTPVLIKGQRAPLVGRVSMDMITVDVTDLPPVNIGDKVICWGAELTCNEIAMHAGTIGYEIMTRMTNRAPKVYLNP